MESNRLTVAVPLRLNLLPKFEPHYFGRLVRGVAGSGPQLLAGRRRTKYVIVHTMKYYTSSTIAKIQRNH